MIFRDGEIVNYAAADHVETFLHVQNNRVPFSAIELSGGL